MGTLQGIAVEQRGAVFISPSTIDSWSPNLVDRPNRRSRRHSFVEIVTFADHPCFGSEGVEAINREAECKMDGVV